MSVASSRRFVRILVYVACKGTEQGLFEVGGCVGASPITAVAIGSGRERSFSGLKTISGTGTHKASLN